MPTGHSRLISWNPIRFGRLSPLGFRKLWPYEICLVRDRHQQSPSGGSFHFDVLLNAQWLLASSVGVSRNRWQYIRSSCLISLAVSDKPKTKRPETIPSGKTNLIEGYQNTVMKRCYDSYSLTALSLPLVIVNCILSELDLLQVLKGVGDWLMKKVFFRWKAVALPFIWQAPV